MSYEVKTDRVDLGDGQYAVFFKEIRHGTQKAVNSLTRPFLKYPEGQSPKLVQGKDLKPMIQGTTEGEIDLKEIDLDAVSDVIIIGQVKEWSFGDVSQAILDGLPESIRTILKTASDRLYGDAGPLPPTGEKK